MKPPLIYSTKMVMSLYAKLERLCGAESDIVALVQVVEVSSSDQKLNSHYMVRVTKF